MMKYSLNLAFVSSLLLCSSFTAPAAASTSEIDIALLDDKTIHPSIKSLAQDSLEDALEKTKTTVKDKVVTSLRLGKNIYSGDYSELVSEGINFFLASLAGQADVVLFKGSNAEFDENSLNICADKFVDFFIDHTMSMLNKRSDMYGVDSQGKRVTIFQNRTFSRFILEKLLPENLPLRGAVLGICNNDIVETAIHRQLRGVAINYLKNLAAHRDSTLKEISGQFIAENSPKAGQVAYEFITAESDGIDLKPVWDFIGPYMTHALRNFTHFALTKSVEAVGKQLDIKVRGLAVNSARVVGGGATYLLGETLELTGSYIPYIGVPVSYVGSMLSSTLAPLAGGYIIGFFGSAFWDATGENVAKRLPGYLDFLNYQIFGYTEAEHRLFNLNPNPSDLERALFLEDYEARDQLQHSYAIMEIIRHLAAMDVSKITDAIYNSLGKTYDGCLQTLWNLFKKNPDITNEQALEESKLDQFIDHDKKRHKESSENAYRRLLVLSETNTKEAEKLRAKIRQHPSFGLQKEKFEAFLKKEPSKANEKRLNSMAAASMLNRMAEKFGYYLNIDGKNGFQNQEAARQILLDLSIAEQDILCNIILNENVDNTYDNILWDVTKKTPKKAKKIIKKYIETTAAEKDKEYRAQNANSIASLAKTSLAEGLSTVDLVTLHKALNTDKHQETLDKLVKLAEQEDIIYSDQELETLKDYYIRAAGFQRGKILSDILRANLIQAGVISTVKSVLIQNLDNNTEVAEIKAKIQQELDQNKIYESLMNAIRRIRNDKNVLFTKEVTEIFNQRRENIFADLASSIRFELDKKKESEQSKKKETTRDEELEIEDWVEVDEIDQDEGDNTTDTDWQNVSLSGSLEIANQNLLLKDYSSRAIGSLLKKDETELKVYDNTATGVGLFIFAQHFNDKKFKEPFFINEKHLKELHEKIWVQKEESCFENSGPSDVEFYNKYKTEILNYRNESSKFKGRSFYGLKELLREFRDHNEQLLRAVL